MTDAVILADLQAATRSLQCQIRTSFLARVITYVDATGRATVQVLRRPKDRRGLPILQPPIPSVPVLWLGMGSLLGIRGTLQPGDDVLCVALDRDHSPYFVAPAPFDAASERMHSISDVVAIPVHFRLTPVGIPSTIRIGGPAALFGVVAGATGAIAALEAAVVALTTIVGAPIPEPPAPGAGAAIDAMAAALLALLELLRVSIAVQVE